MSWSSGSRRSLASPHLPLSRHCVHGVGQGDNVAVICGVGTVEMTVRGKLQALVYDILPSTTVALLSDRPYTTDAEREGRYCGVLKAALIATLCRP